MWKKKDVEIISYIKTIQQLRGTHEAFAFLSGVQGAATAGTRLHFLYKEKEKYSI